MKNKLSYKSIFALIVFVLMCVLFVVAQKAIDQKTLNVKDLSIRFNQLQDLEFGTNLKNQIALLDEQEIQIKNKFIVSTQLLSFIESLESLAQQNNLEITISKVEEGEYEKINEKVAFGKTTLNLQIVGAYEDMVSFINILSKNEKDLTIDSMSIYRTQTEEVVKYTTRMSIAGLMLSYE